MMVVPGYTLADINLNQLLNFATLNYGERTKNSVLELETAIRQLKTSSDLQKLKQINDLVNQKVRFDEDINIWDKSDYWATPLETLGRETGDCEDFAIAKYFFLRQLISEDKLRLTYVKALIGGPYSKIIQAHMVLSYYAEPNAEPLILDNLISEVRGASRRTDLSPVFSFNSEGLWVGNSTTSRGNSTTHLSRWRDLLIRARNEGFE